MTNVYKIITRNLKVQESNLLKQKWRRHINKVYYNLMVKLVNFITLDDINHDIIRQTRTS